MSVALSTEAALRLWPCLATPAPDEEMCVKRFKSYCTLSIETVIQCPHTVHFPRQERSDLKPPRYRRFREPAQILDSETGETTKKEY